MRISDWSSDGCSSDLLPLCLAIDAAAPVGDLLASTQQIVAQGMAHRDYPYARLIKNLGLRRDPSRAPLASVSFNLDRMDRSEEHTSELQSLMRISYAVFCLKKKKKNYTISQYFTNVINIQN